MEPYDKTSYLRTLSEIRFRFKWERYGTVSDRYESNSDPTRCQAGLSSLLGRSHVKAWIEMYGDRYELMPVWVRPGLM